MTLLYKIQLLSLHKVITRLSSTTVILVSDILMESLSSQVRHSLRKGEEGCSYFITVKNKLAPYIRQKQRRKKRYEYCPGIRWKYYTANKAGRNTPSVYARLSVED